MVKLQHDSNKQYKITLPKALIDAIGWKKGTDLKVELDALGNIVLKRSDSNGQVSRPGGKDD